MQDAPGRPGIPPRWTSSAKSGVGTALSPLSRVWFTISHGILNEVYYPRVDEACIRDFGLLVTNGTDFFSEEKRDATHEIVAIQDGIPAYKLTNTHAGRYRITKRIASDPSHDVVLTAIRFEALGDERLRLFALLSPHLVNGGAHNTARTGDYKGQPMLFAEGDGTSLALASSVPWLARSVGFAGVNDGWQELSRNFRLESQFDRAEDGNVALTGEIDLAAAGGGEIILALAFGRSSSEAALRARLSLDAGFDRIVDGYSDAWRAFQAPLLPLDRTTAAGLNSYRISTAVLRAHESPSFPGGLIASLSIPWGFSKGDDDLGGYHLVWPRDLVQSAGALIACGAADEARRVLDYLRAIQEGDGSWPQNTWLDGVPYWRGIQLDECLFPILLLDLLVRHGMLSGERLGSYWPMVRRAVSFGLRHGPVTGQDRWEEDAGFSPFTLGVAITALLVAADMADRFGTGDEARLLRETADAWNEEIERWTYVAGTDLARRAGVRGYYMRIAPPDGSQGEIQIKNRDAAHTEHRAADVISPDALALVRFGLRSPDDPRILETVRAIDAELRVELPAGPCWYRYNFDGYGEQFDGGPFDGSGVGRLWPLMTSERAHYELAAGNRAEAERLLATIEALTSPGGLMPEQVWDVDDIPARELFRGQPSGSAMPLVWAHAEHVKLLRSLRDGAVFDMPPQTVQRYLRDRTVSRCAVWRPDLPTLPIPAGRTLRIDLLQPARVRWTVDAWASQQDTATTDSGLGVHVAELPTSSLPPGAQVVFTWLELASGNWAGRNYSLTVEAPA